ncbi:MAG: hypothetical protein ABIG93_05320 [archaeon]
MIRNQRLYDRFEDKINEEINIAVNPSSIPLPFSLEKILPLMYNSKEKVHELQSELSNNKSYSLENICEIHNFLQPLENNIHNIINSGQESYLLLIAKVIDIGDKFDRIIENKFRELEVSFDKNKNSNSNKNKRLSLVFDQYITLDKISQKRDLTFLPPPKIKQKFDGYKKRIEEFKRVDIDIKKLIDGYQNLKTPEEIKKYVNDKSEDLKSHGITFNNNLIQRAINLQYREAISVLEDLRNDFKNTSDKAENFIAYRARISSDIRKIKAYKDKIDSLEVDKLNLFDKLIIAKNLENLDSKKYNSARRNLFLSGSIDLYGQNVKELKDSGKYLLTKDFLRKIDNYGIQLKNSSLDSSLDNSKEKEIYQTISVIDEKIKSFEDFVKAGIRYNNDDDSEQLEKYGEEFSEFYRKAEELNLSKVCTYLTGTKKVLDFYLKRCMPEIDKILEENYEFSSDEELGHNNCDKIHEKFKQLYEGKIKIGSKEDLFNMTYKSRNIVTDRKLADICSTISGFYGDERVFKGSMEIRVEETKRHFPLEGLENGDLVLYNSIVEAVDCLF